MAVLPDGEKGAAVLPAAEADVFVSLFSDLDSKGRYLHIRKQR